MPPQAPCQPLGNFTLLPAAEQRKAAHMGAFFSRLPDDVVLHILALLDDARDLGRLAAVSRRFYVLARHEPLFRALALAEGSRLAARFSSSWYATVTGGGDADAAQFARHVFSDHLFACHRARTLDLAAKRFQPRKGAQKIDVVDGRELSVQAFVETYERPRKPVVLTHLMDEWPAVRDGSWDLDKLAERLGERVFRCGTVGLTMRQYVAYARQACEERPLYLFDKDIPAALLADYTVPDVFAASDLFGLLGPQRRKVAQPVDEDDEDSNNSNFGDDAVEDDDAAGDADDDAAAGDDLYGRPDHRWLIIGPKFSGSIFHVDPNATAAWNAVVSGRKRWILFPPDCPPPGVYPTPDGAAVAQPVSIPEWFDNFYAQARRDPRMIDCVCEAGQIMAVPAGWWHLVVNMDVGVAVTQNYVAPSNLADVLAFVRDKPDQVSGCHSRKAAASLHERFRAALQKHKPDLLEQTEQEMSSERERKRRKVVSATAALFGDGPAATAAGGNAPAKPFTFSFS